MPRKILRPFSQFGWIIVLGIILTLHRQIPLWFEILLIVFAAVSIIATTIDIMKHRGE